MTCRHSKGDPSCSSHPDFNSYTSNYIYRSEPVTPDSENYEILDAWTFQTFMVMKVRYPNCAACAYEGTKVMVYQNVTWLDVVKWKKIDPHFRDPKKVKVSREAPSPIARFPGDQSGWEQAKRYVELILAVGTK